MDKLTSKWFLFLCILLLCIFFVGAYFQKETASRPAYILSVYDGRVAVFARGAQTPCMVLETRIASLPEPEAERLKNGIEAENAEALQRLIEDYCS